MFTTSYPWIQVHYVYRYLINETKTKIDEDKDIQTWASGFEIETPQYKLP